MQVTRDDLRATFAAKTTEELLNQHAAGTLTDLAYEVTEEELTRRGATPPPRRAPQIPQSKPLARAHRVSLFLATLLAINLIWVGIFQRFVAGTIPYLVLVGIPAVCAYRYFFSTATKRESE